MTDQHANEPPPGMTPPIDTAPPEPAQTKWPMVIGIIAIVFGALGIFQGCFGYVGVLMSRMWAGNQDIPEEARIQMEVALRFAPYSLISATIGLGLAVVLLFAGIGLVRRRPWGRTAILAWSVGKILYSIPVVLLTHVVMRAQHKAFTDAGIDPSASGGMAFLQNASTIFLGCWTLWLWALPVFSIIWMMRAPVRAEVERWELESRAAI